MIKKSKKIIASLLMTLSLVSIFPMTNAFAFISEPNSSYTSFIENECNKTNDDFIYEKDGKLYALYIGDGKVKPIGFFRNYCTLEDGSLFANGWKYNTDTNNKLVWRYFGADYKFLTGYQTLNGVNYYFNESGELKTGWYGKKGEGWHYSYPDGSLREGWIKDNGNWYYIYSDGLMAKSTTTPDGYTVDRKGICKS